MRAIFTLTTLVLLGPCVPHAAHAQIVLSGHHDNSPDPPGDGNGYRTAANGSSYLVPAGATFNNNNGYGLAAYFDIVTVNDGTFSDNVGSGLNAPYSTVTVRGGTFSYNGYNGAYLDSGSTISGGTFSDNKGDGAIVNNITISGGTFSDNSYGVGSAGLTTITGGTFSGNTASDLFVEGYSEYSRLDVYGTFDGVNIGKTKTLTATSAVQSFHGQLQYANSPQTFTYTGSGTIVLHGVAISNPALQITSVTLKGQTDSKATLNNPGKTANFPFTFGAASKDSDTVQWTTTPAPSGKTLHWKITPPDGGKVVGGKTESTGTPPDFQIVAAAAADEDTYRTTRRPALSFTLEAWLTTGASTTPEQDTTVTLTQDELGQLRQEYADHPLTPPLTDSYNNKTHLKKVPNIADFVDTINGDTSKARYNKGLSNWAIVSTWMVQEDNDAKAANGGTSLSFNSAYRNPIKNELIYDDLDADTNNSSQHQWGDAMDFATDKTLKNYLAVTKKVVNSNAQCIWEGITNHVHVQRFFLLGTPAQPKGAELTVAATTIQAGQSLTGTLVVSQTSKTAATIMLVSNNKALIPDVAVSIPANTMSVQYTLPSKTGVITRAATVTITTNPAAYSTPAPSLKVTVSP